MPWPAWKKDIKDPAGAAKSLQAAPIALFIFASPCIQRFEQWFGKSADVQLSMLRVYMLPHGSGTFEREGEKSERETALTRAMESGRKARHLLLEARDMVLVGEKMGAQRRCIRAIRRILYG
jgi:hypothetical protein